MIDATAAERAWLERQADLQPWAYRVLDPSGAVVAQGYGLPRRDVLAAIGATIAAYPTEAGAAYDFLTVTAGPVRARRSSGSSGSDDG